MKHVLLAEQGIYRLAFFLAMEEWVARNLDAGEYVFMWDVPPTVIIGHNQDIQSEVNLDYCRRHNIDVVRRKSGGGAVYADRDNIMMSYICDHTDVKTVFERFTSMVASQLQKMGFDAVPSGRNDITIGSRKISGNAYYLMKDRSIVHGTMLYDTNMENMLNAITPSMAKLSSKGVVSVEGRIVCAKWLRPEMELKEFRQKLMSGLETSRYVLGKEEIEEIKRIEERYYDPLWIMEGKSLQSGINRK